MQFQGILLLCLRQYVNYNSNPIVLSGDLVLSDSPIASITILANDNAYGIFSFNQPLQRSTEEGTSVRLK